MVAYHYSAIDSAGKRTEGQIMAVTIEEAERKVSQQGLSLLSIRPGSRLKASKVKLEPPGAMTQSRSGKRVSAQDAATVLQNLAVMAETGVPFVEAIESTIASARTAVITGYLVDVKEAIVAGQGLSSALRSAPNMFPPIIVDMIRVAEQGGQLHQALSNGADYLQRAADLQRKIKNAMMYPLVMLAVSFITILVLVVVVMPRFAKVFSSMRVELPLMTQLLLSSGDFARKSPVLAVSGLLIFLIATHFLLQQPAVRTVISGIATRLPIIGDLLKRLALARSLQSIATLAGSNVPLLQAIEAGARVAGNPAVTGALEEVASDIEHGMAISDALSQHKVFPKQVVQMVVVGERTGRLPELLAKVCASMEVEVDAKLKSLVAILEPLMILTMGLIVGSITVSIIGPIYSVIENIK